MLSLTAEQKEELERELNEHQMPELGSLDDLLDQMLNDLEDDDNELQ